MIEVKNLNYTIVEDNIEKNILKNINLKFDENKIYVITGPNGSGKSTLVKLLMGINNLTDGQIFFDGKDITNLKINERANLGISYAFQQPVTFKGLKVRDLLDVASGKKNDFNEICNYLSMVGLCAKDYINRSLDDKLSGGELKRIELAMVLCRKSKVNSLKNSCNIIVSHQKKILEIADEVILIKNGEVQKVGSLNEILPLIENNKCNKLRGEDGQN